MRLDARGCGQRIESLLLEERGAPCVEDVVVAVDVAQVASGAHDVVPGAAFALKQAGDVVEGAAQLGVEVADVHALAVLVDRGGARNEQDSQSVQIDAHAARKRARLGIGVGLVEHAVIGHGALFDGRVCDGFQNISKCIHDDASLLLIVVEFRGSIPWRWLPRCRCPESRCREHSCVPAPWSPRSGLHLPFASRTVISGLPSVSEGR